MFCIAYNSISSFEKLLIRISFNQKKTKIQYNEVIRKELNGGKRYKENEKQVIFGYTFWMIDIYIAVVLDQESQSSIFWIRF